jgi:hypothetical protein
MKIGRLEMESGVEWVVYDPLAGTICKSNGQVTIDRLGKIKSIVYRWSGFNYLLCFSKDSLDICGMKGCGKTTLVISPIDIKWFYKINKTGLCINRSELHKIIEEANTRSLYAIVSTYLNIQKKS